MNFLLIALCFFSTSVLAEISTEKDNSRSISDLMYLPEAGTWYIGSTSISTDTESTLEYQNQVFYTSESKSTGGSLEIGKAVHENFFISLAIPYLLKNKDSTSYGPASSNNGTTDKTESDGLGDFSLAFKWRVIEQNEKDINFDLNFFISPDSGVAESASTTRDGNNFRGGTNYGVGFEIGKKLKSLQLSGGLKLENNGSRKYKSLSDDSVNKGSSYTELTISGQVQLMPTESFFLNAGLDMVRMSEFNSTSDGSKTEYDVDPYFQLAIGGGYQFSKSFAIRIIYTTASAEREIKSGTNEFSDELEIRSLQTMAQIQF